jgi:hypothetical protein
LSQADKVWPAGQSDFLVSAAFTPADDQDYDNWYRQEHLFDVAKIPGCMRSERFEIIPSQGLREATIDSGAGEPPKFLTLVSRLLFAFKVKISG